MLKFKSLCEVRHLNQFVSCLLTVKIKEIGAVCLILLLFTDFSDIFQRTAFDRAICCLLGLREFSTHQCGADRNQCTFISY